MKYRFGALAAVLIALTGFGTLARAQLAVKLRGAGATFPYPLYEKWFASFAKRSPGPVIEYRPIGSGAGMQAMKEHQVDFAGSDVPLTDEELAAFPDKVRMIPTVVGGVVPVFRLDGVLQDVRFTPGILAGIYLGKIVRWNDPLIKAANKGVALPARKISVIHRSDSSGTTRIWTSYLASVSPEWKAAPGIGSTVSWPTGTGREGNEGVADAVAKTEDSIGYVEFIYALQNRLSYGMVQNAAGRFVQADLTTIPAAAADFSDSMRDDLRLAIVNAPGQNAWPIASLTYLLVPSEFKDSARQKAMNEFLAWMLTFGQKQCAALGYAALPPKIADRARQLYQAH